MLKLKIFFFSIFLFNPLTAFSAGSSAGVTLGVKCSDGSSCNKYCVYSSNEKNQAIEEKCFLVKNFEEAFKSSEQIRHKIDELIEINNIQPSELKSLVKDATSWPDVYSSIASKYPIARLCKNVKSKFEEAKNKYEQTSSLFNCPSTSQKNDGSKSNNGGVN